MRTAERLRLNGSVRSMFLRATSEASPEPLSVRSNMQRPSGGTAQPSALLFCEASEDDGGVMWAEWLSRPERLHERPFKVFGAELSFFDDPVAALAAVAGVNVGAERAAVERTVYFGKRRSNTLEALPRCGRPPAELLSSFSSGYDRLGTFMPSPDPRDRSRRAGCGRSGTRPAWI